MRILIEMPDFLPTAFSYVNVKSDSVYTGAIKNEAIRKLEKLNDAGLLNLVYLKQENTTKNCISSFKDLIKKIKKWKPVFDSQLYWISPNLCKERPWEDNDLYYEMMDKYGETNEKGLTSIPVHRWWDGSVTKLINSKKAETA